MLINERIISKGTVANNRFSIVNSPRLQLPFNSRIKILGTRGQQAKVFNAGNTGNINGRRKIFRNQRQNQANNSFVINRVNNNVGFKKSYKCNLNLNKEKNYYFRFETI